MDWGLFMSGLDRTNEGSGNIPPLPGSGVFRSRGVVISPEAAKMVEELIHISSLEPE